MLNKFFVAFGCNSLFHTSLLTTPPNVLKMSTSYADLGWCISGESILKASVDEES